MFKYSIDTEGPLLEISFFEVTTVSKPISFQLVEPWYHLSQRNKSVGPFRQKLTNYRTTHFVAASCKSREEKLAILISIFAITYGFV